MAEKNKGGRPTKYRPEFCELLIEHMERGLSLDAFTGTIKERYGEYVGKRTIFDWLDRYPEFREAKDIGEGLGQCFLEEMGLTAMNNPSSQFNSTVWIFAMKNRCGWRDKVENTIQAPDGDKPGFNVYLEKPKGRA